MHRIVFSILLLNLLPMCGAFADVTAVDVILVAGQSNAVGFDARPTELPPDVHDSTSGNQWTHLQAQPLGDPKKPRTERQYGNFAQADGGFGPEIGLARSLRSRSDRKLAIVKAAFSGTGMRTDWNPDDPGDGGACYRTLIAEAKAAVDSLESDGGKPRIRDLVWVQGESDANSRDASDYATALPKMPAAVRKELATSDMVVLLAVNTRFGGGNNPYMPKIIAAQQEVADADDRCIYVDTAKASIANNVHFDAAGTLEVGRLCADALLKLETSGSDTSNQNERP